MNMVSTDINTYVTFGYMLCIIGYLSAYIFGSAESAARKWLFAGLILVWCVHTAAIGLRWVESYQMGIGHAPLSNLYESLIFFGWAITLALIFIRLRFKADVVILLGLPIVFLVMAYTFLEDSNIKPLIPALQSNWLVAHVITCFLGYAGFAVSFVAAVLLLLSKIGDQLGDIFPRREILDEIVYRSILMGYPLLTLGIITGAAWADYAWGSYWSWDPKETWSLVTWLVYSAFLHARLARGWTGDRTAILSVVGFGAVLFTYFGVNYLPVFQGLHSYF
jgi:cytochrome c-type biogenesis protein CcsB